MIKNCKMTRAGLMLMTVAGFMLSTQLSAQGDMAATTTSIASPAADFTAEQAKGLQIYTANCVGCHGASGEGPVRKLVGGPLLERKGAIITQIVNGGHFMPGFPALSDDDVAAVSTYVRNSFGNKYGPVSKGDVADYR